MSHPPTKPLLRGHLHQEAFFISIGACALLLARTSTTTALIATSIYSLGLLLLFGFSAFYHRVHWQPNARAVLRRIDHSAIFILIAGTTTPVALLALPAYEGQKLMWVIWAVAVAGVAMSVLWVSAPKWITALLCVGAGWLSYPYLDLLKQSLSAVELALLVAGGIVYSLGAVFYALKKPNLIPGIFGYHELFHLFTIIAAALHFSVIYNLVARSI